MLVITAAAFMHSLPSGWAWGVPPEAMTCSSGPMLAGVALACLPG